MTELISGFSASGRAIMAYIWMSENIVADKVALVSAIFLGLDSLTLLWTTLYFQYVSRDWRYLVASSLIVLAAALVYHLFLHTDSPKYFYSVRKFDEARRVLTVIARANNVIGPSETFNHKFQLEHEEQSEAKDDTGVELDKEQKSLCVSFLRENPFNLRNTIIFSMLSVASSFGYHMLNFYVKYLPGNFFQIQMVSSLAEAAANFSSSCFNSCLSIRKGFLFSFFITLVASVFLLFAKSSESDTVKSFVPFLVLLDKFGITVAFAFLYFAPFQFFEPKFFGLCIGISNTIGKLSTIMAPVVAESGGDLPMGSIIVICTAASVSVMLLKNNSGE